jgi:hypothetical protein
VSAPRTALPLLPWRERTAWQRLDAWANGDTAGAPYIGTGEMLRDLRALLAPHAAALGLPLPDRPYNCAALFHTDNDRSDTVGLMQALADALEPDTRSGFVGVLTDDRLIRTWDGTRQAHAPLRPGITLTLTPTP